MMAISPSPFDRIPKARRAPSRLWLVWLLAAALLAAGAVFFRAQAADVFWHLAAPAVRLRAALSQDEVARLRAELASTSAALSDRDFLYRENLELKARLGRTDAAPQRVLAAVLQSPPWSAYDTLVIDAGNTHGVAVGDYVSAGGSTRIGRITEAHAQTARAELLSAPGASYQAILNGAQVAVEGQGGGSMQTLVPAGTQVKVGDLVHFPGILGGVAAEVSAVEDREGESFIVVYMRLPVNPGDLRFVEVIKP